MSRSSTEQFPKLGAGQYGAEISALLVEKPDVVHSSFWGGDMEAFILQGKARGVFDDRSVILTAGETAMYRLATQIPNGVIIGARGPHGVFAPDNELNRWFRKAYSERFGAPPTYPSYKMVQAILGLKAAVEKAAAGQAAETFGRGGDRRVRGIDLRERQRPGRHEARQGSSGDPIHRLRHLQARHRDGQPTIVDIVSYAAECANPPEGVKSEEWIKGGFKGAKCN